MPSTERRPLSCTYLLTFTCYGTRLHGSKLGSVDRDHAVYATPYADEDEQRLTAVKKRMVHEPYRMDATRRDVVLKAIRAGCEHRDWELLASHVRSNHVHALVAAQLAPEKVLSALKSYASKALNDAGLDGPSTRRWTRHGSTRYLWKDSEVEAAIGYVIGDQGRSMAVYEKQGRGRWAKPTE